jgi:hypothetical protein
VQRADNRNRKGKTCRRKVPNKELDEKTARPEVLPISPIVPKPQPELEFGEAGALFRKITDL